MNPVPIFDCDDTEPDIIGLAFALAEAAAQLVAHVRTFYYEVMLSGHACPECAGALAMDREGQCRCRACGYVFDPTVVFQECTACGGKPRLRVRRYECRSCGAEVPSRFLFDGLVFDAAYFRAKMAEHRQRQRERRERIRQMLSMSRSEALEPGPASLDELPDLAAVLNRLSSGADPIARLPPREEFNLQRYEAHVQAHLGTISSTFDEIPPLSENALYDRVWRFIALLFLAQGGIVRVWQEGPTILVTTHEVDRERQRLPVQLHSMSTVRKGRFELPTPSTRSWGPSLNYSPTATTRTRTESSSVTSRDVWNRFQPAGRALSLQIRTSSLEKGSAGFGSRTCWRSYRSSSEWAPCQIALRAPGDVGV
jgi:rubredoxin